MEEKLAEKKEGEKPLPEFRRDLEFYTGPNEPDGSPTYNLYDPIKGQYYKIKWIQYLIFKNLTSGITLSELIKKIDQNTTIQVTKEQITHFFNHAASMGLLALPKTSIEVEKEAESKKVNPLKWLLFHYLYFRVPLFNPDEFLEKTLPYVRILASKFAFLIYFIIFIMGTSQLFVRFDEYIHTFSYLFTLKGIIIFGFSSFIIKFFHELGHAYTAKNYGVKVKKMGVIFLVLMPVLYTDVTEGWRLPKRSQRLAISSGGVIVELVIAALCTFLWSISEPGLAQSIFFVISSVSWISTLMINLNPAMRYDGYYLLSDLWGIDNLQPRSFAIARWKLRKMFLGIDVPPPESGLSSKRVRGMVIYSVYTWIYRLFLYTGIALFVYSYFTKILGIFLFLVEIGFFLLWPILWEIGEWKKYKNEFHLNLRLIFSCCLLSLLLLWLFIPISHRENFVAITIPMEEQILYSPYDGKIEQIFIKKGEKVTKGMKLIQISSKELEYKIASLKNEKKMIDQQIKILTFREDEDPEKKVKNEKAFIPEKKGEEEGTVEKLEGLEELKKNLLLTSQIDGMVYQLNDELKSGIPVGKDEVLGKIANFNEIYVMAFIPEDSFKNIKVGNDVTFYNSSDYEKISGKIDIIIPDRLSTLKYPQLASINKGELAVTLDAENKMQMVDSYYVALISLQKNKDNLLLGETGFVEYKKTPESKFFMYLNQLKRVIWRESGL